VDRPASDHGPSHPPVPTGPVDQPGPVPADDVDRVDGPGGVDRTGPQTADLSRTAPDGDRDHRTDRGSDRSAPVRPGPSAVAAEPGVLAPAGDRHPASADHTVVAQPATPVVGSLVAVTDDDDTAGDARDEAGDPEVVEPAGVRVRGWAGRGPVGLTSVKPPKWVKERAARRTSWGWRMLRLATGAEWNGRARTNATWLRSGSKAYAWSGRLPSRVAAWPRLVRAAARWTGVAGAGLTGWAWLQAPTLTAWTVGAASWLVLAAVGWTATDSLLGWPHRQRRVWPLHHALAPKLGYSERTPPRRYLYVPSDYATRSGQVEVALPPDFVSDGSDDRGRQVASIVRQKLALANVTESWRLDGRNHFLILRPKFTRPVPRWARVSTPAVREIIESLAPSRLLLGLTAGGAPVTFDLDNESPHVLLAVGSGGGKSENLKNIGAQLMHDGAEAWIFDYKFTSHDGWALDVAVIFRHIEEIHRGLVALGRECQRRNEVAAAASAAREPRPVFRRLAVLLDEAPMTIQLLKLWWTTHRRQLTEDDIDAYGDPSWEKSPAVIAIFMALSMGRERLVNVALVSQIANANEIGGSAIRGMFNLRILGRQPQSAWKMAAPEIENPPVCSRKEGRLYVVMDGQLLETQGTYWTNDQAYEWAVAGQQWSRGRGVAPGLVSRAPARDLATGSRAPEPIEVGERLVTIKAASTDEGDGIVPYTHQTLRKLQATDLDFPHPARPSKKRGQPHLYHPDSFRRWHSDRTREPQPQ
jgi:hypothetical protein